MVWINEVYSTRNMDEQVVQFDVGRIIPDFEILESKIASALKKTADFKR